jgi:hypothetical protein
MALFNEAVPLVKLVTCVSNFRLRKGSLKSKALYVLLNIDLRRSVIGLDSARSQRVTDSYKTRLKKQRLFYCMSACINPD